MSDFYIDNTCPYNGDGTGSSCAAAPGSAGAFNSITNALAKAGGYAAEDAIYLKREQIYRELLYLTDSGDVGPPINYLLFDAYGSGARPIVSGADLKTGWTVYSGDTYQVALTTQCQRVYKDGVTMTLGSGKDALNDHEWFWASNVLYFRDDSGNPDTTGAVMEAAQRSYCFDSNSKNRALLRNLQFEKSNSYCIDLNNALDIIFEDCLVEKGRRLLRLRNTSRGIFNRVRFKDHTDVTIDSMVIQNASYGLFNFCIADNLEGSIQFSANIASEITKFNNTVFHGFKRNVIKKFGADSAHAQLNNCLLLGNTWENNTSHVITNTASGGGTITLTNSLCLLNPFAPNSYGLNNVVDGGNNIYIDPRFQMPRRPGIIIIEIDDYSTANLALFNQVAAEAELYGYRICFGVETWKVNDWPALADIAARGHEITCQSRNHPNMTELDALVIQYVGAGSACTMTISGNTLTTSVTGGPGGEELNIDLTNTSYDRLSELVLYIHNLAAYTCSIVTSENDWTKSACLDDVSAQDIRTAAYTAAYDQTKFFTEEITTAKSDIDTNIGGGYDCTSFSYPFSKYDADVITALAAAGFESAFPGESTTEFYNFMLETGVNPFKLRGSLAETHPGTTNIERNISALVEMLNFVGGVWVLFSDGVYTLNDYITLFQALAKTNVLVKTFAETMTWLKANTVDVNSDGTLYRGTFTNGDDWRIISDSPCVDAGYNDPILGMVSMSDFYATAVTDANGNMTPAGTILDIGAYEYPSATPTPPAGVSIDVFPEIGHWPYPIKAGYQDGVVTRVSVSGRITARDQWGRVKRFWDIPWELLLPEEERQLREFYLEQGGRSGRFYFFDPYAKRKYTAQDVDETANGITDTFTIQGHSCTAITVYVGGVALNAEDWTYSSATGANGEDQIVCDTPPNSAVTVDFTGRKRHLVRFDSDLSDTMGFYPGLSVRLTEDFV
jgi:peptidoglycan/xylan/chitin deacetylase (PgdA/CDA1 family)